jgi:hypothetical protein
MSFFFESVEGGRAEIQGVILLGRADVVSALAVVRQECANVRLGVSNLKFGVQLDLKEK